MILMKIGRMLHFGKSSTLIERKYSILVWSQAPETLFFGDLLVTAMPIIDLHTSAKADTWRGHSYVIPGENFHYTPLVEPLSNFENWWLPIHMFWLINSVTFFNLTMKFYEQIHNSNSYFSHTNIKIINKTFLHFFQRRYMSKLFNFLYLFYVFHKKL